MAVSNDGGETLSNQSLGDVRSAHCDGVAELLWEVVTGRRHIVQLTLDGLPNQLRAEIFASLKQPRDLIQRLEVLWARSSGFIIFSRPAKQIKFSVAPTRNVFDSYLAASRGERMLDKNTFFNCPVGDLTLIASPLMTSNTVPVKSFSFPEYVAVGGW